MKSTTNIRIFALSGLFALTAMTSVGPSLANAQESKPSSFRIDTDIYVDLTQPPIKQTLTLFSEGTYYDFEESDTGLITVIDPIRNRLVLLNRKRQVKTTLPLQQLQLTVASARTQADAKFTAVSDSLFETKDNVLTATVRNDFLEYQATAQPVPQPDIAQQYADFADWSARLNAVTQPKLPPFLRMDLNQLLAKKSVIPIEIHRRTHQGGKQVVLHSRLIPVWRLSQDDHARVARCGAMLADFQEVSEQEYWSPSAVQQASAQAPTSK